MYIPGVLSQTVESKSGQGGSLLPLEIQAIKVVDLMKMCHFNFFDMYMVFDIRDESLHCYMYETEDIPRRDYITMYYNYLLRL